jgi:phosphorylase/glycogen(starch) synthase
VHYETWTSNEWKDIQQSSFGADFQSHHYDKKCFDKIYEVPDAKVWDVRNRLRGELIKEIRLQFSDSKAINYHTPRQMVEIKDTLRDDILTIGFARRFATYKRAHLLFKNLDRLRELVNNEKMPVQFLFAGKAHPADKAGQDLISMIVEISKRPEFLGKIVFVQNYDIRIAQKLTQGVDVWMNTPTRPLEASGTSGEKAVMNGVMNLSVLDGWWVEGYREDAGWALPMERSYAEQSFQDELDSETLYGIIENEIAPTFYDRDKNGLPKLWIDMIKNTIAKVASDFTTNRMMQDYEDRFYKKLVARHIDVKADNYHKAKEIAEWKRKVSRVWDSIEVLDIQRFDLLKEQIMLGKEYDIAVTLDIDALDPRDIGVELVLADQDNEKIKIKEKIPFVCTTQKGGIVTYTAKFTPEKSGIYFAGIRMYADNENLPHRQDFALVRWI